MFRRHPKPKPRRTDLLSKASKAQARGKPRKAIAAYRALLEDNPDDPVVQGKLARLLAQNHEPDAAWATYRAAASGYEEQGFRDKAIGVMQSAADEVPHIPEVWLELSRLHLAREQPADALDALLDGQRHLRRSIYSGL